MDRVFRVLGSGFMVLFAVSVAASHRPAPQTPPQKAEAKPGEGRDVFLRMCTECHGLEDVIASRRSQEQWRSVVDKMLDKGAAGTDEEIATTLKYLTTTYGRVNVNKAPAEELVLVLGITQEQADAIVKFRTDHGPFADFDALTKVSGLETDTLTKERDAIAF
jgi:competence protein ComEA